MSTNIDVNFVAQLSADATALQKANREARLKKEQDAKAELEAQGALNKQIQANPGDPRKKETAVWDGPEKRPIYNPPAFENPVQLGWLLGRAGASPWMFTPLSGSGNAEAQEFGYDIPPPPAVIPGSFSAVYLSDYDTFGRVKDVNAFGTTYFRDRWMSSLTVNTQAVSAQVNYGSVTLPSSKSLIYAFTVSLQERIITRQTLWGGATTVLDEVGDQLEADGDPYLALLQREEIRVPTGMTIEEARQDPNNCTLTIETYGTPRVVSEDIGGRGGVLGKCCFNIGKKNIKEISMPTTVESRLKELYGSGAPWGTQTYTSGAIYPLATQLVRLSNYSLDGLIYRNVFIKSGTQATETAALAPPANGIGGSFFSLTPASSFGFVFQSSFDLTFSSAAVSTYWATPIIYEWFNDAAPGFDWSRFREGVDNPSGAALSMQETIGKMDPQLNGLKLIRPVSGLDILDGSSAMRLEFYNSDSEAYLDPNSWSLFELTPENLAAPRIASYNFSESKSSAFYEAETAIGLMSTPYKSESYCRQQLLNLGFTEEDLVFAPPP
jgi:hypothetical protein